MTRYTFEELNRMMLGTVNTPGYCVICEEETVSSTEPDQEAGWCPSCKGRNVKSVLVIEELIT